MKAGCCENPKPLEKYWPQLHAKVTVCANCGKGLDYRPLRPKDEPSGEHDPLLETTEPPSGLREDRCAKQGGALVECSTGALKAHECHHSKWARGYDKPRTFNGPCGCMECHAFGAE